MEKLLLLYSSFDVKIAIIVLISYAIIDWLYAKYTIEVTSYNDIDQQLFDNSCTSWLHFE